MQYDLFCQNFKAIRSQNELACDSNTFEAVDIFYNS